MVNHTGNPVTIENVLQLHAKHGIDLMKAVSEVLRSPESEENPAAAWNRWLMSVDGLRAMQHFYGDDLGGRKYVEACGQFVRDIIDFFGFATVPVNPPDAAASGSGPGA